MKTKTIGIVKPNFRKQYFNMKFFKKLKEHFFKAFEDDMPTIEFVSYTGEWPCLCSGTLTIKVDGK